MTVFTVFSDILSAFEIVLHPSADLGSLEIWSYKSFDVSLQITIISALFNKELVGKKLVETAHLI